MGSKTPSPVTHFPAYDTDKNANKDSPLESRAKFDSTMPRKANI